METERVDGPGGYDIMNIQGLPEGLPQVIAEGFVQRDAEFRKINDQGGFLKFTLRCVGDEIELGGRRRMSYYTVDRWLTLENNLLARLTKDTPVSVKGTWKISRGRQGTIWHSIDAEVITILKEFHEEINILEE